MGVDAGTVYAEIRLQLDKLQSDMTKMDKLFVQAGTGVDKQTSRTTTAAQTMAKKVTAAFSDMSKSGINQFAKMAQGINAAFMALPIIGLISMVISGIKNMAGKIGDFINETAKSYVVHQQELAKMTQVLNSTGAAAWTSTRELEGQADQLAQTTKKTIDEIMKMQSVLLGFRSITGDTFNRATKAIIDMTSVMGGDLASTANIVGKAIDTPVQGMTALSRQGFVFTKQEKELVKSLEEAGKHFEAQNIILGEIEKTFGGTAQAIAAVTEKQTELTYETDRLKRAQGEMTNQTKEQWAAWKVAVVKAHADAIESYNRLQAAYRYNPTEDRKRVEALKERAGEEFETEYEKQQAIMAAEKAALEQRIKELEVFYEKANYEAEKMRNQRGLFDGIMPFISDALNGNFDLGTLTGKNQSEAFDNASYFTNQYTNALKDANVELEALNKKAEDFKNNHGFLDDEDKIEAQRKALKEIQQIRRNTLEEIKRINTEEGTGVLKTKDAVQRRADAYNTELNAVNQLITKVRALNMESEEGATAQQSLLDTLASLLQQSSTNYTKTMNEIAESGKKTVITTAELVSRRTEMINNLNRTLTTLKSMLDQGMFGDGIAAEQEYEKQVLSARKAFISALQKLMEDSGLKFEDNPETMRIMNEQLDLINAQIIAERQLALEKWKANNQLEINTAIAKAENDYKKLLEIEKGITLEKIKQSDIYKSNSNNQKELEAAEALKFDMIELTKITGDYNKKIEQVKNSSSTSIEAQRKQALDMIQVFEDQAEQTDEMKIKIQQLKDKVNEYFNLAKTAKAKQDWLQIGNAAISAAFEIANAIGQIQSTLVQKQLDEDLYWLEKRNEAIQKALDEEYQMRLYAAGLGSAVTKEQWDNDIANAIATGNHSVILEKEQAKKRYEIDKDYNDKKEKADKDYNNKKMKMEYEAALAQWNIQVAMATASAAQAVIMAAINTWPIPALPMMGLATGVGIAQIAAVVAAKPSQPHYEFDTGGIMPGDPYRGDAVPVMAKGREMFLTENDQKNLFDMIRAGKNDQPIVIHNTIELSGDVIADYIVEAISNGNSFIRSRGIVG
jgi:hypothetical protein